MKKKCAGCGIVLQTNFMEKEGYVSNLEKDYCLACYKLMHYGKDINYDQTSLLELVFRDTDLLVYVINIMNIDYLLKIETKEKYNLLIINFIDILPASTSLENILSNVNLLIKRRHLNFLKVFLVSAGKNYMVDELKDYLKARNFERVYFLGLVNSGKTTIFNLLTNSNYLENPKRGMTRNLIVKDYEYITYFDTIGIKESGYIDEVFEFNEYKDIIPRNQIKPTVFQVKTGNKGILFQDGLIGIVTNSNTVIYASSYLKLNSRSSENLEKIFEGEEYKKIEFVKKERKKYQITLLDIAIMIVDGPFIVSVMCKKGLHVSLMEEIFR
ncbi:MAG: 50S ribosome-binding GTPase [Acholeplasmatales bacterium]|jgi:ribosome biogenesis GTPase A|nr:50S ribosome-binding GTPase [Acholeplasmatales bacterium]